MQLRLTRHALEDLQLSVAAYAHQPATDFADAHEVVSAFVDRRSQSPVGQEWTNLPVTRAPAYNLHHGRYRGLTWFDEESDVVWLLGVGWHESGSRVDAYRVLKRRDVAGSLMPTEVDYLDLELTLAEQRSFAAQLSEQGPALMVRAREAVGVEVRGVIAARLGVGVMVEVVVVSGDAERLEEVWIGFELPPLAGRCELPPQEEWIMLILAAMLPEYARVDDFEFGGSFPRPGGSRPNEIVVCWRSF